MPKSSQRLHLLLSSSPDSLVHGAMTSKKELDVVCELPWWSLSEGRPDLLFHLDPLITSSDVPTLHEMYCARLSSPLQFGAWLDLHPGMPVSSYVTAAQMLTRICEMTDTQFPALFLYTERSEPFTALDASMPVGLGALVQAAPKGTRLFLSCPQTPRYVLMSSLLPFAFVAEEGKNRLVFGASALVSNPAPSAENVFLAPWWEE